MPVSLELSLVKGWQGGNCTLQALMSVISCDCLHSIFAYNLALLATPLLCISHSVAFLLHTSSEPSALIGHRCSKPSSMV